MDGVKIEGQSPDRSAWETIAQGPPSYIKKIIFLKPSTSCFSKCKVGGNHTIK